MENLRRILGQIRRAADDYGLIDDNDRIAVGISGGKDSLTLLAALCELRKFYPKSFEVRGIIIDNGFPNSDFSPILGFGDTLGVKIDVIPTDIYKIVFELKKEKNPCSLCARMRRGAIYTAAEAAHCNKLALGHHFDDVVETFMLRLFNEGMLASFAPLTTLDGRKLTLIRPLIYTHEKDIRYFVFKTPLPIIKSPCPADKHTEREEMKRLLAKLERENRGLKHRIFGAMCKSGIEGFHE